MSGQYYQEIVFYLENEPSLPVEAELINPRNLRGKSVQEILEILLWYGKSQVPLGEFFRVEVKEKEIENSSNIQISEFPHVILRGNLHRFKRLGQEMDAGNMAIYGDVGFHAGTYMKGGQLTIEGNAGDYLGAHMSGGAIRVRGSAGNFVGAAYRGYARGMSGGSIFIEGNAGILCGARMGRGLIVVQGYTGDHPGYAMKAGSLVIGKKAGIRVGANMVRGTIVLMEPPESLLPTFSDNCIYQPSFWRIFYPQLEQPGFQWPKGLKNGKFRRLSGDLNEGGKGEILIWERDA